MKDKNETNEKDLIISCMRVSIAFNEKNILEMQTQIDKVMKENEEIRKTIQRLVNE